MANASQDWVNTRVFPMERELQAVQEAVVEINNKWSSRDADLANAEFVFDELGGTRRTKAVVGDGRSITSTCWPRLTERSPGHPGEFTWSAITHVVADANSQL